MDGAGRGQGLGRSVERTAAPVAAELLPWSFGTHAADKYHWLHTLNLASPRIHPEP